MSSWECVSLRAIGYIKFRPEKHQLIKKLMNFWCSRRRMVFGRRRMTVKPNTNIHTSYIGYRRGQYDIARVCLASRDQLYQIRHENHQLLKKIMKNLCSRRRSVVSGRRMAVQPNPNLLQTTYLIYKPPRWPVWDCESVFRLSLSSISARKPPIS